jgi:putative transposase
LGRRPELVGGGLIRSQGGWSAVKAKRRKGLREKGDERILGSGGFAEKMLDEADGRLKYQLMSTDLAIKANKLIEQVCEVQGVELGALRSGSRRREVSKTSSFLAAKLVKE